ncbi:cyanophycinase [Fulvivirga maritima]|uniref:cyanophycinase n=1 Tax=Fulvivirga maritima TaxID=2904247 RepID=UPI001F2CC904|nr:cyanophycinase [Fulvivirga maritima]UII27614.1 cyanophycinase [Fulvivirga maritima]
MKGILIPVGGSEAKGKSEKTGLDFIEEGILANVVKECGGPDCKIIVIPTASSIPRKVGANYLNAFKELGCTNVSVSNIVDRDQCNDQETLKQFQDSHCVMFSGGDQSRIADIIGGTELHALLMKKLREEKFVIAGTSAGAMAMSHQMIAGGSIKEAIIKGAVLMSKGLGFMPELVIDTHFIRRGRFGRLAEAIAIHPKLIGIGLAEDTGLVIKNDHFKVIGSGMVVVLDASELTHNAHGHLENGTPISLSNLKTHILANGDQFRVEDEKISVISIHGSIF